MLSCRVFWQHIVVSIWNHHKGKRALLPCFGGHLTSNSGQNSVHQNQRLDMPLCALSLVVKTFPTRARYSYQIEFFLSACIYVVVCISHQPCTHTSLAYLIQLTWCCTLRDESWQVELIILAHFYFELSACLDGGDVLVSLAATHVDSYVAEGDFTSLARLLTSLNNFCTGSSHWEWAAGTPPRREMEPWCHQSQ
jgi:hypothetical protein